MAGAMCSVSDLALVAAYAVMIASNALANTDLFGGKDQTEISNQNPTYLTPDGLTFAVWGLIYFLETLMVLYIVLPGKVYQFLKLSEKAEGLLQKTFLGLSVRWRIVIAFILNAAWLPVFNNELFWVALVIILAYLAALLSVYKDLRPSNTASLRDAALLTAGISANLSWIVVASCLNVFFCLGQAGWKNEYGVAGTPEAAIAICVGVSILGCERAWNGKDVVYGFVAGWALQGVYRMQTTEDATRFPVAARDASLAGAAGSLSSVVWCAVLISVAVLSYSVRDSCFTACGQGRKAVKAPTTSPAASPKGASAPEADVQADAVAVEQPTVAVAVSPPVEV